MRSSSYRINRRTGHMHRLTVANSAFGSRARRGALIGAVTVAGMLTAPSLASAYSFGIEFYDGFAARGGQTQPDAVYGNVTFQMQVRRGGAPNPLGLASSTGELLGQQRPSSDGVQLPDLQPGDYAEIIGDRGSVPYYATYDGRPSLDPSICAGSLVVTGPRTAGSAVSVYVSDPGAPNGSYTPGSTGGHSAAMGFGGKASDPGERFAGALRQPLLAGQIVNLVGFREAARPGSTDLSYVYTSIERPVIACPSPQPGPATPSPVPTPAPADRFAPTGTFGSPPKLPSKTKLDDLVKRGIAVTVTSSEDATAVATLSLQTPPTTGKGASAKPKGKTKPKKQPKVEVLGTATAQALAGKPLELKVKAGKSAKSKLGKAAKTKGAKLLVNVILTDAAGNKTALPTTSLSLPKK